jgi:hypothetical protein
MNPMTLLPLNFEALVEPQTSLFSFFFSENQGITLIFQGTCNNFIMTSVIVIFTLFFLKKKIEFEIFWRERDAVFHEFLSWKNVLFIMPWDRGPLVSPHI